MKKITVYETFDGAIYRNEEDALRHEAVFKNTSLYSIDFYDKDGNLYHAIPDDENLNERVYELAEKVHIHNTLELADFMLWIKMGGFYEFSYINSPGFWVRKIRGFGDAYWEKREPRTEDSNSQAPKSPRSNRRIYS